jgi:hypothetical protein
MKEIRAGASIAEVNAATPERYESFEAAVEASIEVMQKAKYCGFALILVDSETTVNFLNHTPHPGKDCSQEQDGQFTASMTGLAAGLAQSLVQIASPSGALDLMAQAFAESENPDERIVFALQHLCQLIEQYPHGKDG